MTDGFAIPGRLEVRGVLVRQVDAANFLLAGQDHHHDLRRLDEIHRLGHGSEQESGNANRPATRVRRVSGLFGEDKLVAFAHDIPGPGLEDRIVKIGQLFGRLPSGHTKLVIRNVRMRAILLHRTRTARGRDELAIVGVPADTCIRCEIGWRALSVRRKAQAACQVDRANENARGVACMSKHRGPPLRHRLVETADYTFSLATSMAAEKCPYSVRREPYACAPNEL